MDIDFLEDLGFTKSEIDVYLALLELGSTTTGPLVDKSGASSSKIYEILDRLMKKGMASYVLKGNIKHYSPAPPERIIDYIERQQSELEQQKKHAEDLLPQLRAKQEAAENKQEATIYRGFEGMKTAFDEALKTIPDGGEYWVYGVPSRSPEANRFFVKWGKKRAARGIKQCIIFNDEARGDGTAEVQNTAELSESKFHSPDVRMPAAVNIFNDTTIIFPSETQEEPLLVKIDDKDVAESFKQQFDIFWDQSIETITGIEGPKRVYTEMVESGTDIAGMGFEGLEPMEHVSEYVKALYKHIEETGITDRVILPAGSDHEVLQYAEARFLPKEQLTPLHMELYGNKVALIDWKDPITTFIISKPALVQAYKEHFETLWNQPIRTFTGSEGPLTILQETITAGEERMIALQGNKYFKRFPEETKEFVKKMEEQGSSMRLIFSEDVGLTPVIAGDAQVRFLPQEYISPVQFQLYEGHVGMIDWTEPITTTIISKPEMVKAHEKYFEQLWELATPAKDHQISRI